MTDVLLAMVPDYGLFIVAGIVFLASLGLPLPSSVVVLTSGGLAATGDIALIPLVLVTLVAFVTGDQLLYGFGRFAGPGWLDRLRSGSRLAPVVQRGEALYNKYGVLAIFLSRTLFSPCGPTIAFVSGVWRVNRIVYSAVAFVGACIWSACYATLGYVFAGQVPEMSALVASALMVGVCAVLTLGFALWLVFAWQRFPRQTVAARTVR